MSTDKSGKEKRPTIRQIASALELSVATVSRVLNNKPDVNPESRERVISYLRKINYQPPVVSSDLGLIGVVDTFARHKLNSYYVSDLIAGIDEALHHYGFNIVLIHYDQLESELARYGQVRILNRLKGLVWLEPMFGLEHHSIVSDHRLPCVVINNAQPDAPVAVVKSDNHTAAVKAVDFLVAHGHTKMGFVGGWLSLANHRDRFEGFKDAIARHNLEVKDSWIVTDVLSWDEDGGYEGTYRVLGGQDRPTGVVLCSDFLATGSYKAANTLGLNLPENVSIVSFDDFPLARFMEPPLTTFKQPLVDMARQAIDVLMEKVVRPGNGGNEWQLMQCPFVIRSSVANRQGENSSLGN